MSPKVSIIMPVYNGEKTLPFCLDSLMELDYPKENLEIIVVDNNSTDQTSNIIKKYPFKYLFEPKKGEAFARNSAIKKAGGDIIAFIDADCIAEKDWLTNLVAGFADKNIAGCGGKITFANLINGKWQAFMEEFDSQKVSFSEKNNLLPWVITENAAFRKGLFDEVGLFDENFKKWGDIDLSWRICFKGYRLKYVPGARVYHILPQGIYANFKRAFDGHRNCWKLWKKYNHLLKVKPYLYLHELFKHIRQFYFYVKKYKTNSDLIFFKLASSTGVILGNIYGDIESLFQNLKHSETTMPIWNNQPIWWKKNNGKIIIFNPSNGSSYQLHNTGADYWQLIMDNKSVEEIIKIISEKYDEEEDKIRKDYYEFLDNLKDQKLISR